MRIMNAVAASMSAVVGLVAVACSGQHEVTDPRQATNPVAQTPATLRAGLVIAWSATTLWGEPGAEVSPPTVRVVNASGTTPVAGVTVSFTLSGGNGAVGRSSALTDADGLASAGSWQLGPAVGPNTLVASVAGVGQVTFTATGRHLVIIAKYDLQTIGGQALPRTYSGGGSSWTITGGHYILADDGSCTFGYDVNGVARANPCYYVRKDSTGYLFFQNFLSDLGATVAYNGQSNAVVRVPGRAEVQKHLAAMGIRTLVHYPIPCHQQAPYRQFADHSLPIAEQSAGEVLSLPMFPHMSDDQVTRVCEAAREVLAGRKHCVA